MGKSEGTNWQEVAYGIAGDNFSKGVTLEQLGGIDSEFAVGGQYYDAANYAWGEKQAAVAQQEQMASILSMMSQGSQDSQGPGSSSDYANLQSILESKDSDMTSIQEALVRGENFGAEGRTFSSDWGQNYRDAFGGDAGGFVFDPNKGTKGGRWRAVDTDEYNTLASDRDIVDKYGGLINAAGDNVFGDISRVIEGEGLRDQAILDYTGAVGSSTEFVNAQIANERQNALLMGIDYSVTDEIKSQRISDQLSTADTWTADMQTSLDEMLNEFGTPDGFEQTIYRGDSKAGSTTGQTTSNAKTAAPSLMGDEEETSTSLLGA